MATRVAVFVGRRCDIRKVGGPPPHRHPVLDRLVPDSDSVSDERAVNDHPDFPDSLSVIGVMEGENDLSMQYFDSRGVHRVYAIGFDGRELTLERDAPGFAQRGTRS